MSRVLRYLVSNTHSRTKLLETPRPMLVSRRTCNCLLDTIPVRIPEIATVETRKLDGNPSMHPRSSFFAVILRADDSRQRYPWYRFVVSSTLKGRERKNWGKNGNDVARSSQKDFIDHRCDATERCISGTEKHPREFLIEHLSIAPFLMKTRRNTTSPFIPTHKDEREFVCKSTDSTRGRRQLTHED